MASYGAGKSPPGAAISEGELCLKEGIPASQPVKQRHANRRSHFREKMVKPHSPNGHCSEIP